MDVVRMNTFSTLHQWAHRQDENFTTEAFFSVVRILLERQPETAIGLLARLTGGAIQASTDAKSIVTQTQIRTGAGVPDAGISADGVQVYLEAKVAAEISTDQLEAYRRKLDSLRVPRRDSYSFRITPQLDGTSRPLTSQCAGTR